LSRLCFFLLAVLASFPNALSHETDQFTVPAGRSFADIGDYLNRWAFDAIEKGRAVANSRIREAIERGASSREIDNLESPERLTLAVREQWPWSVSQIEKFEAELASEPMRRRYPGRVVAYGDRFTGIYQYAFFPLDYRGWSHLAFFSSTIKVYGVYMGTDKLGHFTDVGIQYYYRWLAARQAGKSEREAVAEAIRVGTEGLMSEAGMLGMVGTADYSNADLSGNFAGFLFYRNLTEAIPLKGRMYAPMLKRDGAYWVTADDVGPAFPFFARFVSDHLDEALNPGFFDPYLRPAIRRAVEAKSELILQHYADESGRLRPRAWFDEKLRELETYWGTDYGHRGAYSELISIGSCCFGSGGKTLVASSHSSSPQILSAKYLSTSIIQIPPTEAGRAPLKAIPGSEMRQNAKDRAHDAFGRGPLHDAALHGSWREVQTLLDSGADANQPDEYGTTPLHLACRRGSVAIARLLVDHGADVNTANESGTTPMHEAASSGQMEVVQLLLEQGARGALLDRRNHSPSQVANMHGHAALSEVLKAAGDR